MANAPAATAGHWARKLAQTPSFRPSASAAVTHSSIRLWLTKLRHRAAAAAEAHTHA